MRVNELETLDEALHLLEEGTKVFMLKEVYAGTTVAEMMCSKFVIEAPEEDKPKALKVQGGVRPLRRRSWTGERSRPCMTQAGQTRRSQMRWAVLQGPWIPV